MLRDKYHYEVYRTYYIPPETLAIGALIIGLAIAIPVAILLHRSRQRND